MNRQFFVASVWLEFSELHEKQSQDLEQSPITGELFSLLNAVSNEQYERRYNVRIFGTNEEADEDVYQNIVDVATEIGHRFSKKDISVCHRVHSRDSKKVKGTLSL